MKKNIAFISFIFIIFLLGFGLCFSLDKLTAIPVVPPDPHPPSTQITQQILVPPNYHFFSEDFMIYGKDDKQVPFFLKLSLNRKQKSKNNYLHYYFSNLFYGGLNSSGYVDFNSSSPDVTSQKYFSTYQHEHAPDLSTREKYDFTVQLNGKNITISTDELGGDFIIRNSLEYSKYVSVGKAQVAVDGKKFEANIFVSTIYSDDYTKLLFFDGYDEVQPTTDYLAFWDENDSFYLIDHTLTGKDNPHYRPHTWVLYKDGKNGWMKKAFNVNIDFQEFLSLPKEWNIFIPDFNSQIQLGVTGFFENSSNEGIGKGTVKTPEGTFVIEGFIERHT